jgi:flagellar motor switch protein FliN/FliY
MSQPDVPPPDPAPADPSAKATPSAGEPPSIEKKTADPVANATASAPLEAPPPPPEGSFEDSDLNATLDSLQAALNALPGDSPMPAPSPAAAGGENLDESGIDDLLRQASFEDPAENGPVPAADSMDLPSALEASPIDLPNFQQVIRDAQVSSIDLLRDVELNVKIELGRSRMFVEDVLKLGEGSVVELDKLAGDPVDVFVNDRLVARGEVLVLNDNFCVRVNEIVSSLKDEGA